jgi:hypothetical protein
MTSRLGFGEIRPPGVSLGESLAYQLQSSAAKDADSTQAIGEGQKHGPPGREKAPSQPAPNVNSIATTLFEWASAIHLHA